MKKFMVIGMCWMVFWAAYELICLCCGLNPVIHGVALVIQLVMFTLMAVMYRHY